MSITEEHEYESEQEDCDDPKWAEARSIYAECREEHLVTEEQECHRFKQALEEIADSQIKSEPDSDVLIAIACVALGKSIDWLDHMALEWYDEHRRRMELEK